MYTVSKLFLILAIICYVTLAFVEKESTYRKVTSIAIFWIAWAVLCLIKQLEG